MFVTNASSYMSSRLSGSLFSRLAAVLWATIVRFWRGRVRDIHDFGSHDLNNVCGTIVEIGELGSYGIANFFNSRRRSDGHLRAASSLRLGHVFNTHGLRTVRTTSSTGLCDGRLGRRSRFSEDERLGCGDDVVREPVQGETGRNVEREETNHERKELQNGLALLLGRVIGLRLRADNLLRHVLGGHEQHREH